MAYKKTKGFPFIGAILLVALLLWVAYNYSPQIEKHLSPKFSFAEWWSGLGDDSPRSKPAISHYKNLEIPADFTDDRPDIRRSYTGYTISYNSEWKLPNWVAYELTRQELKAVVERKDDFRPDKSLGTTPQASTADYKRSGFDRGHMAPAADMRWSATAMSESFYLTNMCPQTAALNRGDWERLESRIRNIARHDSAIVIVCGPLVTTHDTTIGKGRVKVPSAFYKVALSPYSDEPQGIGFVFANDPDCGKHPLSHYTVSIDSVEALTGIDFFPVLPDNIENIIESQYDTEYWNF